MNGNEQMKPEKKKMPKWLKILLIVLGVILIISGIVGIDDDESTSTTAPENKVTTTKALPRFSLIESYKSDESNSYFYYIEGKVQNNKDRDYDYVQITFNTYDKEGNMIGTCVDNNSGLNANGVWKFKAICDNGVNDIEKYELKEITGW